MIAYLDRLKELYESWILSYPSVYFLIWVGVPTLVALAASGMNAWASYTGVRDSQGSVTGRMLMEDGGSPTLAVLSFIQDGIVKKSLTPNSGGEYLVALKNGNYQLEIVANGYRKNAIKTVTTTAGTFKIEDIVMRVIPKKIDLILEDKKGVPYSNFKFALLRASSEPRHQGEFESDQNGKVVVNKILDFDEYYPDIISPTGVESSFLRIKEDVWSGKFRLLAGTNSYRVILPKVVFTQKTGANSASSFKINTKYIAQSFTLLTAIKIRGAGFGIGLAKIGRPHDMEIRTDANGSPSSDLKIVSSTKISQGATSSLIEGSFASFEAEVHLPAGKYWLIGRYERSENEVTIAGSSMIEADSPVLLGSSDGIAWSPMNTVDVKKTDIFLTE